jgi:putative ABC transport system ATP-binding protein
MMLIELQNVSKSYDNEGVKTVVLKKINLSIQKGEYIAIMGPSGSGKSTLMHILGFLDRPTEGVYLFEDKETTEYSEDDLAYIRNKNIGFVFQAFNLLPRTTLRENVALPLLYSDRTPEDKKGRAEKSLISVGLENRMDHLSNQISGGQKQRVAIARALVNDPDVLFADEPTGNLDSKSGKNVMHIFSKLHKEGKTIILVTHDSETARHAERIITIRDGEIVADDFVKDRIIPEPVPEEDIL